MSRTQVLAILFTLPCLFLNAGCGDDGPPPPTEAQMAETRASARAFVEGLEKLPKEQRREFARENLLGVQALSASGDADLKARAKKALAEARQP